MKNFILLVLLMSSVAQAMTAEDIVRKLSEFTPEKAEGFLSMAKMSMPKDKYDTIKKFSDCFQSIRVADAKIEGVDIEAPVKLIELVKSKCGSEYVAVEAIFKK